MSHDPTSSGGLSGPFTARKGFDAHNNKGVNFADPGDPTNWLNPSGDGDTVNTNWFWNHANFMRWDGRVGFLPNPLAENIASGECYAVRMDFSGRPLGRIAVWDGNLRGPAVAALPAGNVFGVIRLFNLTDPVLGQVELDGAVTITDDPNVASTAGEYVLNSTGQALTVTGGSAAGTVLNDGDALLWLGDVRIGAAGWAVVQGPNFQFTHQGAAAVGVTPGNWRFLNIQNWVKSLRATADQATDTQAGDFQTTTENLGKEIKVWQNGAWVTVFSEVDVRAWIAALSLFEGTVQENAGTVLNVIKFTALPDLLLNTQIGQIAHYWTFTGAAGYVIKAADPNGVGRDLPGTVLNPGDWLQISNRSGDVTAPDLHWVHVGGDLLTKARGDNLYGLKIWVAGGWEQGSLVVHNNSIWRATRAVITTDTSPGTLADPGPPVVTAAPWEKVNLAAGVRWVSTDIDLPANAPAGEIYFVLQSAVAGGAAGLFYWDGAANSWVQIGGAGAGNTMDLSSGLPLVNVGVPIGSIQMWLMNDPPPGWLILNGQTFSAATYPELAQVLGNTTLPDFRGAFIRGAGASARGWGDATRQPNSWQDFSTARPGNALSGTASSAGSAHRHRSPVHRFGTDWRGGGGTDFVLARLGYGVDGNELQMQFTRTDGDHSHTVSINSGGDAETRPRNFAVHYIIKAQDTAQRVRI